ncbi:hypothetical protein KIF24_30190 [Micromonospora sp. Llam7]|uniref:hypothetical protein n=1 Tax=Micromonospora tarapacensis TaxID=2835305 RepID=UPI001C83A062|nr:hypothetical protein [Micromonospora tarapacensis]MBX7269872.1 hypothetical protein [Micromonospora tarapacensis]
MTESAKKVAEEAEHRLDNLAEDVRKRFDRITQGRLSDQVKAGRFSGRAGPGGHGAGWARTDQHRRQRGGSDS